MKDPSEIKAADFSVANFGAFFQHVLKEAGVPLNSEHFFATWSTWMWTGLARTWAAPGCVLGALITDDLFGGRPRAQVVFWASLPEVRKTGVTKAVWQAFEAAAKAAGCKDILASDYLAFGSNSREAGYYLHGFKKTETVFTKELWEKSSAQSAV